MPDYCSKSCGVAGCDGSESFSKGGPNWPPPKNWECPKCGHIHHSTRRLNSEVLELARAGKGEISPLDQQRILLRDLERAGKIDFKTAARHKRRLLHNEKTGKYRVTDDDRRRRDLKIMQAEAQEALADRQNPIADVSTRQAVEAGRALGVLPERDY